MALVRILVDGYSLLHNWAELAPGRPRHSAAARDELIQALTQYHDATGTPISIFFDGRQPPGGVAETASSPEVEVLFSRNGKTADEMIERAAHRLQPYGEVLVVTDDYAERDTVVALGAMATSCVNFIRELEDALADMNRDLQLHNRRQRNQFSRPQ